MKLSINNDYNTLLETRFYRGDDKCLYSHYKSVSSDGRPKMSCKGVTRMAYQVMWELYYGKEWPAGLQALHSCDNPACCDPEHITPGTAADNKQDQIKKGRQAKTSTKKVKRAPTGDYCMERLTFAEENQCHTNENGCLIWEGAVSPSGYGLINLTKDGKRLKMSTHRMALALYEGLDYDDKAWVAKHGKNCDKLCMNYKHLTAGSQSSNMLEARDAGASNAVFTKQIVYDLINRYIEEGRQGRPWCKKVAEELGTSADALYNILLYKRRWKDVIADTDL